MHILRPFAHLLTGAVLEIGGDDGELARFIAGKASHTVALRADLASAQRVTQTCQDTPGVAVLTEPLFETLKRPQFDAIVLVDPMRGAWAAHGEPGPSRLSALLAKARAWLRPGGVLILALANRFALRHLAGQPEVPNANLQFSLEGLTRPDGFVLPGYHELRTRLDEAGLTHQDWWFPWPDHRTPLTLISRDGLTPGSGLDLQAFVGSTIPFDVGREATATFSLQRAWAAAIDNGLAADLANAFVVACSNHAFEKQPALALHYGHRRRPEFEKEVRFERQGEVVVVRRLPLYRTRFFGREAIVNRFPSESLQTGRFWPSALQAIVGRPGWTIGEIGVWTQVWQRAVQTAYGLSEAPTLTCWLPGHAVDATPHNLIVDGGRSVFIDAEWDYGRPIEFGWLLVRGLLVSLHHIIDAAPPAEGTTVGVADLIVELAQGLGHALTGEALEAHLERESGLQTLVNGHDVSITLAQLTEMRLQVRSAPAAAVPPILTQHSETERLRSQLRVDREIRALRQREQDLLATQHQLQLDVERLRAQVPPAAPAPRHQPSRFEPWLKRMRGLR